MDAGQLGFRQQELRLKTESITAAILVTLLLTTGCATYNQSKVVAQVGGYTMLAGIPNGIGVAVVVKEASNDGFGAAAWGGAVLLGALITGAVLVGSGVVGMVAHDKPLSVNQRRQAEAEAAHQTIVRKQEAWALTKTAAAAARAGDCDTVRNLDPQVLAVDSDFHAKVFLGDVAIKRCLESAVSTPP